MVEKQLVPYSRTRVSPFFSGSNNFELEDSDVPENYNHAPSYEDIRLNSRFELISNNGGFGLFGGDLDELTNLVMSDIDDDEMLDTYLTALNAESISDGKSMLEGMPDVLQEQEFANLPPAAQKRLRDMGYRTPGEKGPGFAWGLGGIPYVGDFVKGVTKLSFKGLGIGAKIVQIDKAWELLMMSGRFAQRTGRSLAYTDAKEGSFFGDIGSLMDGWRMTEHAETSFDENSHAQVMKMGFNDSQVEMLKMYAGFGQNGVWDLIVRRTGLEDDQAIRQQFEKEMDWINSERAHEAINVFDEGRVDTMEYSRKFYNKNNAFLPDAERGTMYGTVVGFAGSMTTEILLDPTTWAGGIWMKAIKLTRPAQQAMVRPGMIRRTGMKMKARVMGKDLKKGPWQARESTWNNIDFWNDLTNAMRANNKYSLRGTSGADEMAGWFTKARAENFFGGIKPILLWRGRQLIKFQDELADSFKSLDELDDLTSQIFREAAEAGTKMTVNDARLIAENRLTKANPDWVHPETYLLKKYKGLIPVYERMRAWHMQKRSLQYSTPKGDVFGFFTKEGLRAGAETTQEAMEYMYTSAFTKANNKGLSNPEGIWEFMHSEAGTAALSTGFGGRGAANAVLLPTGVVGRSLGLARKHIDKVIDFGARDFQTTGLAKNMSRIGMQYLAQQGRWVARELSDRMNLPIGDPNRIVIKDLKTPLDARSIGLILQTSAEGATDANLLTGMGITDPAQVNELITTAATLKKEFVEYASKQSMFDELFNFYGDQGINIADKQTLKNIKTGERPEVFSGWFRVYNNYLEHARHRPGSRNYELVNSLKEGALGTGDHVKAIAVQLMYHPAKLAKKLTTHVPLNNVIDVLDDKTALKEFDSLVEMGILADMPREVIEHFKHTFINGTEAQRWNVQVEFFMDFLARSGAILHGGPKVDSFMRRFISKADHVYDIRRQDNFDFFGGFEVKRAVVPGPAQSAQLSKMNIIPDFRELAGVARYMGFIRHMGWAMGLPTIDKLFSKVWRPSVLLRFGYVPRNGGDELLQFVLREGITPTIRGRLARIVSGRTVMFDQYGTKIPVYKGRAVRDVFDANGKLIRKGEYEDLLVGSDLKQIANLNLKSMGEVHHNKLMGLLTAPFRFASEISGVGDMAVTRKTLKRLTDDPTMRRNFQFSDWEKQRKMFEDNRKIIRSEMSSTIRGKIFYRNWVLGQWAAARSSEVMHKFANAAGLPSKAATAQWFGKKLTDETEFEAHMDAMDILLSHPSVRDSFMRDLFNTYDPYLNPQHSLDQAMKAGGFGKAIQARHRIPLNYAASEFKWVGKGSKDPDYWNGVNSQLVEMSQSPTHVAMARELSQYVSVQAEKTNRIILDELGIVFDADDPIGASRQVAQIVERLTVQQRRSLKQLYNSTGNINLTADDFDGPTHFHSEFNNWANNTGQDNNLVEIFVELLTDPKAPSNTDVNFWTSIINQDWMVAKLGSGSGSTAMSRLMAMSLIAPDSRRLSSSLDEVLALAHDANTTYMRSPQGQQLAHSMVSYELGGHGIAGQTGMAPPQRGAVRVWTPKLSEPAVRVLADYLIRAGQDPDSVIHIQNVIYRKLMRRLPQTLPDREKIADRVLTLIHPSATPYQDRTIGSFEDMIGFSQAAEQTHIPLLTGSADPHVAHSIGEALDEALREIAEMPSGIGVGADWIGPKLEVRDLSSDAFFAKPGLTEARLTNQYGATPRVNQNGTVVSEVAGIEPNGSRIFYTVGDDGKIISPEDVGGFENQSVFAVAQDVLAQPGGVVQIQDSVPQVILKRTYKRKNPKSGRVEYYTSQANYTNKDFNPDDWEVIDEFHTVLNDTDAMIEDMARVQLDGLKHLTLSQASETAMHEIIFELLDDEVVASRLMANGTGADLPKSMYAEFGVVATKLEGQAKFDYLWNKVLTSWFDGVIHPAMEAMVREPMFTHYFAEAWRLYDKTEATYMINAAKESPILNKLGLFSTADNADIIPELEDFVKHVWSNQALDPNDALSKVAYAMSQGDYDTVGKLVSRESDLDFMKVLIKDSDNRAGAIRELTKYSNRRFNAHQNRVNHAMEKAGSVTASFIDDHRIRSQFQEMVGSLIPFWFAEDLYLRRWVRGLTQNPLMLRNLQLTIRGGEKAGMVREDQNGRRYLVIPATLPSSQVLMDAIHEIPVIGGYLAGVASIPTTEQMFRLDRLMPGYDMETVGRPQVGPFISYPLTRLAVSDPTIFEDISPFMQERFAYVADGRDAEDAGNSKLHDFLDAFFPYPISQGLIMTGEHWNRGEQFASAQLQAVKLRQATGRMPTQDQISRKEDPDLFNEEFMEQLDHEAQQIMGMNFTTWFLGTGKGTPTDLRFGDAWDWNSELHWYIQQGWTHDEALLMFYDNHKYDEDFDKDSWETQTKMSLFQTSTTKKVGVGYMQQSENVDLWLNDNSEWAMSNPHATSFLVPYETGLEYNEDMAWGWKQRQIAKGLRELKSRDEYVKDFYFNGAASEYYDRKQRNSYAVAVLQSQNQMEAANELTERFKIWDKGFMDRHPVFFVETQKGRSAIRREATFEEFRNIIRYPELVPDTPHKNEILDVMKDVVRLNYELELIKLRPNVEDYRSFVKAFFLRRIEEKVAGKPYLQPLLNNLVIPYLNQEWVGQFRAGLVRISPKIIPDREWTGVTL